MSVFLDKGQTSPFASGIYRAASLGKLMNIYQFPRYHKICPAVHRLWIADPMADGHPGILCLSASRSSTNGDCCSFQAIPPWWHHLSNEKNGSEGAYCYLVMPHCAHPTSHHMPIGPSIWAIWSTIQGINQAPLDKLAVCGDINRFALPSNCYRVVGRTDPFTIRNVLCLSIPSLSNIHPQVHAFTKGVNMYRMNPAVISRWCCKRSSSDSGLAMAESERVGELHIFLLSSATDVISSISQY